MKSKLKSSPIVVGFQSAIFAMACQDCKGNFDYYCCHEKNKLIEQSDQG
jgi:hypothetical protein